MTESRPPPPLLGMPLLLAAAALLSSACSSRHDPTAPEGAVRLLIAAARAGDRREVAELLGPRTRARIQEIAAAGNRLAGQRALKPEDLVSVGWALPAWEAASVRTVRRDGDDAEVEVASASGDRQTVRLRRERREWKIELPSR